MGQKISRILFLPPQTCGNTAALPQGRIGTAYIPLPFLLVEKARVEVSLALVRSSVSQTQAQSAPRTIDLPTATYARFMAMPSSSSRNEGDERLSTAFYNMRVLADEPLTLNQHYINNVWRDSPSLDKIVNNIYIKYLYFLHLHIVP